MKRSLALRLGVIAFAMTSIMLILNYVWHIELIPITILYVFNIIGAINLGQYIFPRKGVYHWNELKNKQYFVIKSISAEFENPGRNTEGNIASAVVHVEGFGPCLLTLKTDSSFWKNRTPKKGESYMVINGTLCFIDN